MAKAALLIVILLATVLLYIADIIGYRYHPRRRYLESNEHLFGTTILRVTQNNSYRNDTLTYARFKAIEDSINSKRVNQEALNKGGAGSGVGTFFLGYRSLYECDTCEHPFLTEKGKWKYYLELPGYYLKADCKFNVDQGKYIMTHPVNDTVNRHSRFEGGARRTRIENVEVNYRFAEPKVSNGSLNKGSVFIPVSKSGLKITRVIVASVILVFFTIMVYTFVFIPVTFLLSISRGKPFSAWHYKQFYFMAQVLTGYYCFNVLMKYILHYVFLNKLSEHVYLSFINIIQPNAYLLFIAVILFIIGKAFQRGYQLQSEQSLTI